MKRNKFGWLAVAACGGALIVTGLGLTRYQQNLREARARLAAHDSRVIETACGPIEAAIRGRGAPVLVIHGNAGGFDHGLSLADGYIDAGFQVIAPSRFGYLRTPMPENATPEAQAEAYVCLLDALGIQEVAVMTSSAGATSALQLALRHPERVTALALHSPNAPGEVGLMPPPRPAFSALVHSDLAFWALTAYLRPVAQSLVGVPRGFTLTPEMDAEVATVLRSVLPISARAEGMLFDTFTGNPAINAYPLEQVQTPTLVISAVDDPMALHAGGRRLAERIPTARLMVIPDGGHMMLGHTAEVRTAITQFFHSHPAQVASGQ